MFSNLSIKIFIAFSILVFNLRFGNAQEVSLGLTPNAIMIGDHMELVLRSAAKNTIFPAINDSTIGNFRLVEALKSDTLYSGNNSVISKKYIITCFEDSIQSFPSLTFYQGLSPIYISRPISITVTSPNVDSAKDIKPIKDIILVPLSKAEIANYLFVSALLLGFVILLYFIYIKYIRKEKLFDREKPEDPPHVIALSSLKETETLQLWQSGKYKEYYDRISDSIRIYLEKRFGIKALEQTTSQILEAAKLIELPDEIHVHISELLYLSDLAKFAKENPSKESNEKIIKHAYQIVQSTQINYDANKKVNASIVRKFYGQNKYGYKSAAINQSSFKVLIIGLSGTLILLSALIVLAYAIPINRLLGMIADTPFLFFTWVILAGILITLICLSVIRSAISSFLLIFDYNSIIIKKKSKQSSIPFQFLKSIQINKNGNILLVDKSESKYILSKKLEYFDEVYERIQDMIEIEQNTGQNT